MNLIVTRGVGFIGSATAGNLGHDSSYSVPEVGAAAREVTRQDVEVVEASRRSGDPAWLVSSVDRVRSLLGWELPQPELESIVAHAWASACATDDATSDDSGGRP